MSANKRRYSRLDSVINGTFLSREDNTTGDMMMTNFSRDGFKATLSKPLIPGRVIQFQMRYDDKIMPVFATGKVIWVKAKNKDVTYGYDAGIHLLEEDAVSRQKASEYDFDSWHLKQIAEFARQRGYLAKYFPDKVSNLSAVIPSLCLVYFCIGSVVSFVNINIALIFCASLIAYLLSMFATSMIWLFTERSHKSLLEKIYLIFPVSAARISSHISYAVYFIRGLLGQKV